MRQKKSGTQVAQSLRKLCGHDQLVLSLFQGLSVRKNNASATPLSQMCNALNITMKEAVALARLLEEIGCGKYVVGRRSNPTRFVWHFTTTSLSRVALGQPIDLTPAAGFEDEEEEHEESEEKIISAPEEITQIPALSLQDAKRSLALFYNIPIENIDITIRG